ncbi:MAG: Gfo/Idh/MocA family oxidoreductase [Thermoproteota archaeon]
MVGCSVIALRYIPFIKEYGELVAVCDKIPGRATRFKESYGVKEYYTDFSEMLNKSDIDVVFILTGMGIHAKQVA